MPITPKAKTSIFVYFLAPFASQRLFIQIAPILGPEIYQIMSSELSASETCIIANQIWRFGSLNYHFKITFDSRICDVVNLFVIHSGSAILPKDTSELVKNQESVLQLFELFVALWALFLFVCFSVFFLFVLFCFFPKHLTAVQLLKIT